jgi:hypothetical protein
MLRVDVPEEDDDPVLAVYCPYCAEREFGVRSRRSGSATTDQPAE